MQASDFEPLAKRFDAFAVNGGFGPDVIVHEGLFAEEMDQLSYHPWIRLRHLTECFGGREANIAEANIAETNDQCRHHFRVGLRCRWTDLIEGFYSARKDSFQWRRAVISVGITSGLTDPI